MKTWVTAQKNTQSNNPQISVSLVRMATAVHGPTLKLTKAAVDLTTVLFTALLIVNGNYN